MNDRGCIAVLLSGRGSNFEAIFQNSQSKDANFQIVTVISDKPDARGLARAAELGLEARHVSPKKRKKSAYEQEIVDILNAAGVELVCLAGYMRIVGPTLLSAFAGRILNIHPSLLPSFPGLDAQQQALDYGVKVSGCTVHFVDPGVDTGPIVLQRTVPVMPGDSGETLSQRILEQEHLLFSNAITLFFQKRLKITGRKVIIKE